MTNRWTIKPRSGAPAADDRRAGDRAHLLTAEEIRALDEDGYIVVRGALSRDQVARLNAAIDRVIGEAGKGREHNRAAILALDPAFLDMVDLPTIFPKICQVLGWNIWVNHTHFNVNPTDDPNKAFVHGWHRDGGAMHPDLGTHGQIMPFGYMKVGFYLTDLSSEAGFGQTLMVPGSHKAPPDDPRCAALLERDGPWAKAAVPDDARPMLVQAGDACMFHNRLVHSVRSPNTSVRERRALFIQWAYRWLQPVDPMDVDSLGSVERDPVRRQLLGFGADETFGDAYAQGRSRRYYPSADAVPVRRYAHDVLGLEQTGNPW
jgi:ectoine hydroxylase-related dioxygenase (phytanoyl-CoA dioxygenase family)